MTATKLIAAQVRRRTPGWVEDRFHDGFMFIFGDPAADNPGRHIIIDGMTDHPIITANVCGRRMVLELPHVSDGDDRRHVLDALEAIGALDPATVS